MPDDRRSDAAAFGGVPKQIFQLYAVRAVAYRHSLVKRSILCDMTMRAMPQFHPYRECGNQQQKRKQAELEAASHAFNLLGPRGVRDCFT
ncbi:MAG: hypothetical protein QM811_01980 [Pirellulales bacterium]